MESNSRGKNATIIPYEQGAPVRQSFETRQSGIQREYVNILTKSTTYTLFCPSSITRSLNFKRVRSDIFFRGLRFAYPESYVGHQKRKESGLVQSFWGRCVKVLSEISAWQSVQSVYPITQKPVPSPHSTLYLIEIICIFKLYFKSGSYVRSDGFYSILWNC